MNSSSEIDQRDLNEVIHLIKVDDDIDFVKNALVYYQESLLKKKEPVYKDNAFLNFVNVLFMLKKTKKILEILNDKVGYFCRHLRSQKFSTSAIILMESYENIYFF